MDASLARRIPATLILALALLVAGGCSGNDDPGSDATADSSAPAEPAEPAEGDSTAAEDGDTSTPTEATEPVAPTDAQLQQLATRPGGEDGLRVAATRARLVAKDSQFGTVLFDANGQVVYAFERDSSGESACVSADCVKAWPPVLTEGAPTAGRGVTASALGTLTRADGTKQVTYHGRPLYFYEHEAPGEIKCHDVNLHGGLWWVVKPDGRNA